MHHGRNGPRKQSCLHGRGSVSKAPAIPARRRRRGSKVRARGLQLRARRERGEVERTRREGDLRLRGLAVGRHAVEHRAARAVNDVQRQRAVHALLLHRRRRRLRDLEPTLP